jgi:hypothetical protein
MRAFAVSVNGKPLCTAGIGDDGVLSSHVTWSGSPGMGHIHMHVGGLDSPTNEHLRWSVKEIGVGDEITTRIIETEAIDEPHSREKGIPRRGRPTTFGDIDAGLILLDPESGIWLDRESKTFEILPRIGEWVSTEIEGVDTMLRIVMVIHPDDSIESAGADLYAVVEGKTSDCLKRLLESSG